MCLIVIIGHLLINLKITNINFFSMFCNGIFFFLSGYGIFKKHMKDSKYKDTFFQKRILKVLIPYLIASLIYYLYYRFIGHHSYSLKEILKYTALGFPLVKNSWFIINLIVFYLFSLLLLKIFKNNYKAIIIGMVTLFIYKSIIIISIDDSSYWFFIFNHNFIIGMLWAYYEKQIYKKITDREITYSLITFIVLVLLIMGITYYYASMSFEYFVFLLLIFTMSTLYTLSIILINSKYTLNNKILNYIGSISYELYLYHGLFIMLFRIIIKNDILYVISTIIFVFLFSIIVNKITRGGFYEKQNN